MCYGTQTQAACANHLSAQFDEQDWEEQQVISRMQKDGENYPFEKYNLQESLQEMSAERAQALANLLEAGSFEDAGKLVAEISRQYQEACAKVLVEGTYDGSEF